MTAPTDDHNPAHGLRAKVSAWFWSLTPSCREVARLTSEGRDRILPLGTRMRLSLHRGFCQWCARYAEQLDLMHEASRRLPEQAGQMGGPGLGGEARTRLKRALRAAGGEE